MRDYELNDEGWMVRDRVEAKEAANPFRRAKRAMMRECHLSPRQWRKFRKQEQRKASEEMRNA